MNDKELVKQRIEERYERLRKGKRRPSLEYITPTDLRAVFFPYVEDKKAFQTLTDEDVKQMYEQWLESYKAD